MVLPFGVREAFVVAFVAVGFVFFVGGVTAASSPPAPATAEAAFAAAAAASNLDLFSFDRDLHLDASSLIASFGAVPAGREGLSDEQKT